MARWRRRKDRDETPPPRHDAFDPTWPPPQGAQQSPPATVPRVHRAAEPDWHALVPTELQEEVLRELADELCGHEKASQHRPAPVTRDERPLPLREPERHEPTPQPAARRVPPRRSVGGPPGPLPPGVVVEVRVLGPIDVVGWASEPTRAVVTELCCYLVLHRGHPVSSDALMTALWPEGVGAGAAKSLRTYLSLLRRSLGRDLLPDAARGAGYMLREEVSSDWERFCEHVSDAEHLERSDDRATAMLVRERALSLVRAAPFSGVTPGSYGWAWSDLVIADMERTIASCAHCLGSDALSDDDLALAEWAARAGLAANPYDDALWTLLTRIAASQGPASRARVARDRESVNERGRSL